MNHLEYTVYTKLRSPQSLSLQTDYISSGQPRRNVGNSRVLGRFR